MFNIGNETKPEIEFTEIEGYNINGEKIEKSGNGLVMGVLALFLFGGVGFLGYNYLQDDSSPQKSAVMGVSRINPLNKSEIERGLNEIHQDMEARGEVNKKVATQSQSYKSKEEISDKLDGMVDMFYNKEAIPAELDNMVEDFYSNQPSTSKKEGVLPIPGGGNPRQNNRQKGFVGPPGVPKNFRRAIQNGENRRPPIWGEEKALIGGPKPFVGNFLGGGF